MLKSLFQNMTMAEIPTSPDSLFTSHNCLQHTEDKCRGQNFLTCHVNLILENVELKEGTDFGYGNSPSIVTKGNRQQVESPGSVVLPYT